MATAPDADFKLLGPCDPVLHKIKLLKALLEEAEAALAQAELSSQPILEVGITAIRGELSRSSRRLRLAS